MPTCVAARPTPGAAYIVWIMSSTSCCSPSSNAVTGSAARWSGGSPYRKMGRSITGGSARGGRLEPAGHGGGPGAERALELADGIAAELLDERVRQHERHH